MRSNPYPRERPWKRIEALPLVLLGMAILFFAIQPRFLSITNLTNIGRQVSVLALLACGQLFVVLVGGIDLSLGSVIGLSSVVTASSVLIWGLIPGVLLGLLTGALIGTVNGVLVSYLRIPAMIATLAMLYFARGAGLILTGGMPVERLPPEFGILGKESWVGVPLPMFVAAGVFALCYWILRQTRMGREMYAIGGSEETSRLAGISIRRYKAIAFAISGTLGALGGVVLSSRLSSGHPVLGDGLEFQSIAAVVVGGARLGGGKGTIPGTVLGVLFLGILANGLNLARVSSYTQMIAIGCVLVLALVVDRWRT